MSRVNNDLWGEPASGRWNVVWGLQLAEDMSDVGGAREPTCEEHWVKGLPSGPVL